MPSAFGRVIGVAGEDRVQDHFRHLDERAVVEVVSGRKDVAPGFEVGIDQFAGLIRRRSNVVERLDWLWRRFGKFAQLAQCLNGFCRGRGRAGERRYRLHRIESPTNTRVQVTSDRAEVVAVKPEVQLEVVAQRCKQGVHVVLQFDVVCRPNVERLVRLVLGDQSRPNVVLPLVDDRIRGTIAQRRYGRFVPLTERGVQARCQLQNRGRRWFAGACCRHR